jgi:hypothetical protein
LTVAQRHLGVRLGDGQIQHDIDVVARQQILYTSRIDCVAVGLVLCSGRVEIAGGGNEDIPKARCVFEIDVRNVATPNEADAHGRPHGCHRCPLE